MTEVDSTTPYGTMKRLIITLSLMAFFVSLPISAQYYRGSSRHHQYSSSRSYADLVEVSVREPGTLEDRMPREMYDQVRMLRVEGPLNERDLGFITKLAKRSKVVDGEGKSVSNYLDVDLERASVMEKRGSRINHDVLPRRAFEYAARLRSIVLPEHLKAIGEYAFLNCYDLEEVIMPNRVYELGEEAFSGCDDLKYFMVPDGLESIGQRCFNDCKQLTQFRLPGSVRQIGKEAFNNSGVRELYIPTYCQIENDNLGMMPQLQSIEVERGNTQYSSIDRALYDRDELTLILYPAARSGKCRIPDGVECIGKGAFYKSKISEVELPNSITQLGSSAFSECKNLTSIWLPDGVAELPANVFNGCTALRTADIGHITMMGEAAFHDCHELQSIKYEGSLTLIPKSAFENCKHLQHIELPATVQVIGEKAFHECNALHSIEMGEQLTRIGKQAFDRCFSLDNVVLPSTVTSIEDKAFFECGSLRSIELSDQLRHIGKEAFRRCKQLTQVVIPAQVTEIEKEAFRECTSLNEITLNTGLRTLGDNALRETAIKRLIIPSTVTHMGKKVAEKCHSLLRVECMATTPPELDGVSNEKIELYVPSSAVETYKNAKNWKKFKVVLGL